MRLLVNTLSHETDIVTARKNARRIAELLGFAPQDRARITTAVSEIARNALEHAGGGRIAFAVRDGPAPLLEIAVCDDGPGLADPAGVLSGEVASAHGLGIGLRGAGRLMDTLELFSRPGGGTRIEMTKRLPQPAQFGEIEVRRIRAAIEADDAGRIDPIDELRRQNQEMLRQLEELQDRQDELQRLNQELHDTNRGVVALYAELDDRADHLRRADELKTRFLSNMSHEFRTPLNSILALSRLLLARTDGELTAEQERQVQFVRKAAESLTELVDDLLDLAKVEAGKTVVTPARIDLSGLFGTLRGMLRPLLVGDAVALVFEEPRGIPELVTDDSKLSQILRNFLSNAIKFTERGEVRVSARYDAGADTVSVAVADSGIGIAAEDIELIFQEFAQATNPLQRRVKGTGLGLPLARRLAELLGGAVSVVSTPGQGSTFTVTVPREYRLIADGEDAGAAVALDPDRVPVLLVEDDAADAFALERALARSPYQPVRARSIGEAREVLARIPAAAILLDLLLVGEESWRFLLELRSTTATERIPVVVISSTGEATKAQDLGADAYLGKPARPEEILGLLDRLTGRRSLLRLLLVEDEEVMRYLVRQLLPLGRYGLNEAATGEEALQIIREAPPDLLLLDLNLPGISGLELLESLRRERLLDALPVVILTAARVDRDALPAVATDVEILAKSALTAETLGTAIGAALARVSQSVVEAAS